MQSTLKNTVLAVKASETAKQELQALLATMSPTSSLCAKFFSNNDSFQGAVSKALLAAQDSQLLTTALSVDPSKTALHTALVALWRGLLKQQIQCVSAGVSATTSLLSVQEEISFENCSQLAQELLVSCLSSMQSALQRLAAGIDEAPKWECSALIIQTSKNLFELNRIIAGFLALTSQLESPTSSCAASNKETSST